MSLFVGFVVALLGTVLLFVVCMLAVAFYVGFNEVMGWHPSKRFFAAMDKAAELSRLARKLKRRGNGGEAA